MAIARSKLTAQGQISVPAEVRRKLGIGPGSVLEWEEQDDCIVVRRSGQYTCADVHAALFPAGDPRPEASTDIRQGIRKAMRRRHARR
jgi:AbrB family looped-hinge helix DNA binding protein